MADDETHPEHLNAKLVGNFDRWEKIDNAWHGWGAYVAEPDERAAYLTRLVKGGELRGISADVEPIEVNEQIPAAPDVELDEDAVPVVDEFERTTDPETGQEYVVVPLVMPRYQITEGRLMGATVVPFPAYDAEQVWIDADSGGLAASAARAILSTPKLDGVLLAADVRAVDGEYGIWICGAMRPSVSLAQVREVMSAPPSGDWRRFGRDLELVAALCVNVPGFNTPRGLTASGIEAAVRFRKDDGLISSLILSHPAPPREGRSDARDISRAVVRRIAASVGRSKADRRAAVAARVGRV